MDFRLVEVGLEDLRRVAPRGEVCDGVGFVGNLWTGGEHESRIARGQKTKSLTGYHLSAAMVIWAIPCELFAKLLVFSPPGGLWWFRSTIVEELK